jgi:FtsP/CotA-like multicopper oxidase with cupredoxin domain
VTLDLLVSAVAAGAWLAAAACAAAGRSRAARALVGLALAATVARIATAAVLAASGWWFVQEKVTLTLPLLLVGAAVALVGRSPVWLFTAGYAALAGPLVTVAHGYPSTWSLGLVTVGLAGGAATLTGSVLGASRLRAPAVASATALLIGAVLALLPPGPEHSNVDGVSVASLRGPSTGGVVRRFSLDARQATVTLPSGATVRAWTFNGLVPGPPITARVGDLVEVTLHNTDIAGGVTLHWHGYDVPAGEDGVPGLTQDAVLPGQSFVYHFRADRAGTYWYHTHEASSQGVRMGLYGTLIVTASPAAGVDLTVPVHTFNGSTVVSATGESVVAPGSPVRLRLVNTDSTPRTFGVVGSPVRVVAVDGTDLNDPAPVERTGLRIAAGGRYDVAFTMPDHAVALRVASSGAGVSLVPSPGSAAATADVTTWPGLDLLRYGTPAATPFGAGSHFDRDFTLVLDRGLALVGGVPAYAYTVNGAAFPNIATEVVRQGDLVRFTIVNRSLDVHPWHLHGHRVLVLSRDGAEPTGSPLWMDTFDVLPGEVWQVAFRADNPGIWMNHCHNLAHADQGMALHLAYEGVTSPYHGGHGG